MKALAAALLVASLVMASATASADVHGVPLPAGSRPAATTAGAPYRSGRSFRDSVEHVRRWLARRALRHEAIPVYRRPGVTVARFLSREPTSPWTAIHVFSVGGVTYFFVVPRRPAEPRSPATPGG